MESPVVTQLFRQLFRRGHPACQYRQSLAKLAITAQHVRRPQFRAASSRRHRGGPTSEKAKDESWQMRNDDYPKDMEEEFKKYPTVTANDLRGYRERPRRVKMLMRDFIEDSLYNPHYGYFSKQVVIFSPGEPFNFNSIKDELEFQNLLAERYRQFEDKLDETQPNETRQLWYTPTELFRPYYGEAIAEYLVQNYKLTHFPYRDLIIYEMGAGRGTLMLNILDYIRATDPDVYDRTKFKIIEISSQLAHVQTRSLLGSAATRGHRDKVEIINKSIFDWSEPVRSPCFFLAFEVFDNFAHDVLRYDRATEEPLQGSVLIDEQGDFFEFYSSAIDPVASRFLEVRHKATGGHYPVPYPNSSWRRRLQASLPFAQNLSDPEYIPTRLMQFFHVLHEYFPAHRLVTSDFHSLPEAIKGLNAPIVQTRFNRRPVPVTTPLVHQGYFDIMFPTDFNTMEAVYQAITGKLTRLQSHETFMKNWAFVQECETRNGENPLISWYRNASVMTTVTV